MKKASIRASPHPCGTEAPSPYAAGRCSGHGEHAASTLTSCLDVGGRVGELLKRLGTVEAWPILTRLHQLFAEARKHLETASAVVPGGNGACLELDGLLTAAG